MILVLIIKFSNKVCLAAELVKSKEYKVTFFALEKYRDLIEKSGSQYRSYSNFDMDSIQPQGGEKIDISQFFNFLINIGVSLLPELIKYCEEDQPDLIIMDNLSMHARYLQSHLRVQQKKKKQLKFKMPKFMMLYSCFAQVPGNLAYSFQEFFR
jgi:UDP:flavonoid glycosyltransferase YjiC (YdhE family)